MKNALVVIGGRLKKVRGRVAVAGGSLAVSLQANAALDAAIDTAIDGISANVTDMLAAFWPVYLLAVGGFVAVKLFKRGASKV